VLHVAVLGTVNGDWSEDRTDKIISESLVVPRPGRCTMLPSVNERHMLYDGATGFPCLETRVGFFVKSGQDETPRVTRHDYACLAYTTTASPHRTVQHADAGPNLRR